ncbi:MAG TPA: PilZ domain-containing protein [Pyrinomonadaceae bacterium]|nr:PilZ domain-containing protein [Pyrinomonadaceae bacterium]
MPELIRSVVSRMRTYVKDRRRSPRLRVRLLFSVSVCRKPNGNGLRRSERLQKGHTRDISIHGLGLNVPQIHVDGHHLAAEGSELELRLELPGGAIPMRVVPRRYERLDEPELGCNYLVGVQIVHIDEEDRRRYLSFVAQGLDGKF